MKKRKPQGKLDFLPNRNNKYSIRRFTVGTASILIGATLIFGAGEEAKAAESNDAHSSVKADDSESTTEADSDEATSSQDQPTQDNAKQTETTDTAANNDQQANDAQDSTQSESDATSQNSEENQTSSNPKSDIQDSEKSEESDADSSDNTDTDVSQSTGEEQTSDQSSDDTQSGDQTKEQTEDVHSTDSESKEESSAQEEQSSKETSQDDEADKQSANKEATSSQDAKKASDVNDVDETNKQETKQASKADEATSTSEDANSNSEAPATSDQSESSQPESAKDVSVDTTKQSEESNTTQSNFNDIKDSESAEAFYKQATGVSDEEAKEMVSNLGLSSDEYTPENVREALLKQIAAQQEAQPKATALRAADASDDALNKAVNEAVSEGSNDDKIIDADALASGYIDSNTDATNAPHTLSGRAWVADKGTPATMSNGLTAVPEGTEVYMQWLDRDGAQSPIYRAKTKNVQSSDGSQVGPGAYAFDLRDGWTDANGKTHKYGASPNQYYRLWIPDYKDKDGNTVTMLRQAGGFVPGTYINSATGDNIGQFPLAGTNMQRTGIFMMVKPNDGYMTKDKEDWIEYTGEKIGQGEAAFTTKKNLITGSVWQEVGRGTDLANSATGPNRDTLSGDKNLEGYRVVFSSLTKDGAKAYDEAMKGLEQSERASAAKQLLTEHPEYISATVTDTTDDKGRYTVQFPDNALDLGHVYGYVEDPDGNMVSSYSSFTSPEFRSANSNLSFTPQLAPITRPINNSWENVNFAVVEVPDIHMTIPDYNSTDKPVVAGDNVTVDLTGKVSPLPTHIEWKDKDGKVVKKTEDFTDLEDGESQAQFTIPDTAKDGDVYTAYLYEGDRIKDASSVVVKETDARKYDPEADEIKKEYGEPTTKDDITKAVTIPDYDNSNGDYTISVDDENQLPDGTTPGTSNVPVTVTYPDGTEDHIDVPVTVGAQKDADKYDPTSEGLTKDNGDAPTADEITSTVTIPGLSDEDKEGTTITVDKDAEIPDGTTPGTTNVPVTVTYPDGTTDHVDVPVTIGEQPDNEKYDPSSEGLTKDNGDAPTADEITSTVTIPGLSDEDKEGTTITVDKDAEIPDGTTPGTTNVPVTVTYPDGTTDHVDVPVTIGEQPDNEKYDPSSEGLTKDNGDAPTADEITSTVTIPGLSDEDKEGTTITVDKDAEIPDGTTPGTTNVPVTVTYPDGTTDHVDVPVTIGEQPDNEKYDPSSEGLTKDNGDAPTADEITSTVTIPGLSDEDKEGTTITVDKDAEIPDGTTPGTTNVPVTVTYPDGTTDHVDVPVTIGEQPDNEKYDPTSEGLTKDNGDAPTDDEITSTVTIPGLSDEDKEGTTITVDKDAEIPDGTTPGTTNVPVTVTYPDGTTDHVDVPVTIGEQPDNEKYDPTSEGLTKDNGDAPTDDEITSTVTIPGLSDEDKEGTTITVDKDAEIPDGTTPGTTNVPVTVTYPDGTTDHVDVPVTINEPTEAPVKTPTISTVGAGDDKVSGTGGTPGNKVDVTIPGAEDPITATVGDDGTWSVDVPEGVHLNGGDIITAVESDDDGHTSDESTATVGEPNVTTPSINNVGAGDDKVSGTNGTPGNTIEVTIPGVKDPITTTVGDDGTWSVDVPKDAHLNGGDTVSAIEKDDKGNASKGTETTVGNPDVQAPTVAPVKEGETTVTGQNGTPGNTIEVTIPGVKDPITTTVNDDGTWSVEVPEGSLHEGDVINATEVDGKGNHSTATPVTVGAPDSPDQTVQPPMVNPINDNSPAVGGTGTPGNTIVVTWPDGSHTNGTVNPDGSWEVDVPNNVDLQPGQNVSVVEKDQDGNTSTATTVPVNASDNGADNPGNTGNNDNQGNTGDSDNPGNTGDNNNQGSNGDQPAGDNNGNQASDNNSGNNDNQGSNGAQSGNQGQTITPAVNPIGSNDQGITGQHGTPGNTVTATFPDGTTASTTVNADGTWSIPTPSNTNLNNGDVVSVTEQDANGNTSNVTQVTVGDDHITQGSEQDANTEKALPDTGNSESNKGTIFGTIFAALGAMFLFGRRRKNNKDEQ